MPPRNNIVMIKRENPEKVVLPNGRVFYAKYKRVDRDALPPNIRIMRRYKQRAAPKGKRRRSQLDKEEEDLNLFLKKQQILGKKHLKTKQ